MNREFRGVWVPVEIWMNKELSITEKCFLVEIDSLDGEEGCYASNAYFSSFFNLSKGRCTQIIKKLENNGWLKINLIYNGKVIEKRVLRVVRKLNRGSEKTKQGYLENAEDNNTKSNNTKSNKSINVTTQKTGSMKDAEEVVKVLFEKAKTIDSKLNLNPSSWTKDIEKGIRIDKVSKDDYIQIILWIYHGGGGFWIPNILSGKKLREKYNQLLAQKVAKGNNNHEPGIRYEEPSEEEWNSLDF